MREGPGAGAVDRRAESAARDGEDPAGPGLQDPRREDRLALRAQEDGADLAAMLRLVVMGSALPAVRVGAVDLLDGERERLARPHAAEPHQADHVAEEWGDAGQCRVDDGV